jgi:hypothetical protein
MSTTEEKPTGEYRQYLPDLGIPRFTTMQTQDAHEYAHAFKTQHIPPWLYALFEHWRDLYEEPYQGISTDGITDHRNLMGERAANLLVNRNHPPGFVLHPR